MRLAYFDCFAGASGDMLLASLVDAGAPLASIREGLAGVALTGYRLEAVKVRRGPLAATQVRVDIQPDAPPTRTPAEALRLVAESPLSGRVKGQARSVLERLVEAEAKVHGVPLQEVHLHEMGSVDTLVDILGVLLALELLQVDEVFASPLPAGEGSVSSGHGILPIPAPATLELLARAGAPLSAARIQGEAVTPTGAALLTAVASFRVPAFSLRRVGYGAGSRDTPDIPNVLRVWLGESQREEADLVVLETNIDDMDARIYGYVMESLMALGALDVWFTPIQMKKDRPAVMVSVLARPAAQATLVEALLRETSTLGVRIRTVARHEAEREEREIDTSLGRVRVKVKRLQGSAVSVTPEFEDCRRLARERGLPLQEVMRRLSAEAGSQLLKGS